MVTYPRQGEFAPQHQQVGQGPSPVFSYASRSGASNKGRENGESYHYPYHESDNANYALLEASAIGYISLML